MFDSVSVVTTFKKELAKAGVIFCSISEALREHPELVKKYLGSVVPQSDNYYAALNAAVFSDGSFVYIPPNTRCPMELSTYFRINEKNTGQFERTLIIADKGSYVSYLEGCTAPMRDENQLHAAVVELIALDDAEIKYSTVQNWYPGDKDGKGGIYNFVTKRGDCRGHNSKISWTQVETGSAITWKYPSCILRGDNSRGEFYSIAISNGYQQVDSGTKMIHLGKNTSSRIISKGIAAGHSQNTYRGLVSAHRKATGARNFTNCDSLLIGDKCGAHTVPYIEAKNSSRPLRARGDHVEDLRGPAVLRDAARALAGGGGGADRQRLRARRAPAAADGIHGRDAEADRHLAGRERGVSSFREQARKRALIAKRKAEQDRERIRKLESIIDRMAPRVLQEREWLAHKNIRVFSDRDWSPNIGIRICRTFDGRAPQDPFEDDMACCSIWTGDLQVQYNLIEFVRSGPMYSDEILFPEGASGRRDVGNVCAESVRLV